MPRRGKDTVPVRKEVKLEGEPDASRDDMMGTGVERADRGTEGKTSLLRKFNGQAGHTRAGGRPLLLPYQHIHSFMSC